MTSFSEDVLFSTVQTKGHHQFGTGFSVSVQGARHVRNQTPCQDSSVYLATEEYVFCGVADGHGDKKHAMSHIGSKLALEVAHPILFDALRSLSQPISPRDWTTIQSNIEKRIRWEWNCECKRYMGEQSPTGEWTQELLNFGTTLLATCQSEHGTLFFQLGDGDIAIMNDAEEVQFIFEEDDDVTGTITHSLCRPFEENISKCTLLHLPPSIRMVLLSSDGIRDCLQGDRNRFSTILPWLNSKRNDDTETLNKWLYSISNNGNGDDISLSIHYPNTSNDTSGVTHHGNA